MQKSKKKKLPEFATIDEFVKFCDEHDLSDYIKDMEEIPADVDLKTISYEISLDIDMSHKLDEIAEAKNTTSEDLIKTWTKEKIEVDG